MRKEYVAILLGGFLTAMTASGASYISTKESVARQDERLISIEQRYTEIVKVIKKISEDGHKTQVALTEIATVIKIKLGDSNATKRDSD